MEGDSGVVGDFRCVLGPPDEGSEDCLRLRDLALGDQDLRRAGVLGPGRAVAMIRERPGITGPAWAPPALAGGKLYCRSNKGEVVCVEVGKN